MTETPEGVVVTQELLPCPFCGAQAQWVEDNGEFDRPFGLVTEHTENCFMGGRMMAEWETIIAAWNTRAHTPTLRGEEVERLIAQVDKHEDFVTGDDGFVVYWPTNSSVRGAYSAWMLRAIADELDRRNADWSKAVDAALSQPLAVDTGQSGEAGNFVSVPRDALVRLLNERVGELPTRGWLKDNDRTRLAAHELAKALAATPAPSVSPDPAGEEAGLREAARMAYDLLDTVKQSASNVWYVDADDPETAVCDTYSALEKALASSPIPKTFPREAVVKALSDALDHYERNICEHEDTHRGGTIWTICDSCDRKWADDEGGFQPFQHPSEIVQAQAVLAALLQKDRQS